MNVLPHVVANVGLLQGNGVVSDFFSSFHWFLCSLLIGCEDDISANSEDNSSWLEVDSDSGVGFASNSDWWKVQIYVLWN